MAEKPDRFAQIEQENAELRARLANIEKLLAHQRPVVTPLQEEMEREEAFERRKAELSLDCKVRTQIEARKRWTDSKTEIPVKLLDALGAEAVAEVLIPARSVEEARGRFDALCGIQGVDIECKYIIGQPRPAEHMAA